MKKTFIAMASVLAFSACCNNNAAENKLAGKWNIDSAMGVSTEAAENPAFIEFAEDGSLNGCTSVNLFNSSYTLDGETLTFGDIAMTKMMGLSMEVEDAVTAALNATAGVLIDGEQACILDAQKDTVMVLSLAKE